MPASAPPRPLDLKRQLLLRVGWFTLVLLVVSTAAALLEARQRVRGDIDRTGPLLAQLISDTVGRSDNAYSRTLSEDDLDSAPLHPIAKLVHVCVRLTDIYSHPVAQRCFAGEPRLPAALRQWMRAVIGADAVYQGAVGRFPGIAIGQLTVTPDYDRELLDLAGKLARLLALSAMLLLLSFFIYRPVRNALAPSADILDTLSRMEAGDLRARMPAFALIELNRIGAAFNHLLDRLDHTIRGQQRLAHRLLSVREEERAHLARELHDELGQYLASLNAEAAFARELALEGVPALLPCAESIGRTSGHMMEVLQQILHRLRPSGLTEFGLLPSLQQLVADWNTRSRGRTVFTLAADGLPADMPDDVGVSVYRIVQESLTNAVRHGRATRVDVTLDCGDTGLRLSIGDDGQGGAVPRLVPAAAGAGGTGAAQADTASGTGSGGYGLLGMEERVLALGGSLRVRSNAGGGTMVRVELPLVQPQPACAGGVQP
ncbi:HAMP domain-containing sensor histidine kinase [Duganella sp. LX20W]|uniref:histidine kinase n=1 Tax=Rugamonas brunnea TaxID=2758569 RepID=A0A7W2IAZ4_9BURK|nr:HAMP domain-containing sensor histidine kinase [Rugamonas brunnea]MBA5636600.1 HAMP domain-containing sensor histidine kinase [Rugamonas brunnea]